MRYLAFAAVLALVLLAAWTLKKAPDTFWYPPFEWVPPVRST